MLDTDRSSASPDPSDAAGASPRPRRRKLRIGLAVAGALAVVALAATGVYAFTATNAVASQVTVMPKSDVFPKDELRAEVSSATPDAAAADDEATIGTSRNILLLGSDSRQDVGSLEDAAGNRADTIMVVNIPGDGSSVTAMSIMRDNWVTIPGHGEAKINAAMAFGGVPLMVQTVEEFIGARIDHVALVDFEGFKGLTDALGGVTVNNTIPFTSTHGKFTFAEGPITLHGNEALGYVRERYSFPDGDYQRVRNQQAYLRGVLKGLSDSVDPARLLRAADAVAPYVSVDDGFSVTELIDLGVRLQRSGADLSFFTSPTLGTGWAGDQSIVVVDWEGVEGVRQAFANGTLPDYAANATR